MSISPYYSTFLNNYSSQLLQNDLLTNSVFFGSGVGMSLRDMVLAQSPIKPLTNPFEQAITGRLRSDAASTRQYANNVGEAASMVGMGREAVGQIQSALNEMEEVIEKINAGELDASSSTVQENYNDLRNKIQGLVEDTDYNGIYMLDKNKWGTEQISAEGKVYIHADDDGGFNVNFYPMNEEDSDLNWSDLQGSELETDLSGQQALVDEFQGQVNTIYDMYENKEGTLKSQEASLNNQADILDQAVRSRMTTSLSVEQILLDLILGDSGSIINEST
ncbi:MAG: flagellin [Desulfonatronovibrionaceae bacterium]